MNKSELEPIYLQEAARRYIKDIDKDIEKLQVQLESSRTQYHNLLRDIGFKKTRRDVLESYLKKQDKRRAEQKLDGLDPKIAIFDETYESPKEFKVRE